MTQAELIGGKRAKGGYYWNKNAWEIVRLEDDGDLLPGDASDVYLPVSLMAVLILIPTMGALYVMFLPLIGFRLAGRAIWKTINRSLRRKRVAA